MKTYTPHTGKKVWWICSKNEHHTWEAVISSRTSKDKTGCPYCKQSKLEKECEQACQNLKIKYEIQKTYEETKNIKHLPYDFFLPDHKLDIELQGIQHFQLGYYAKTPEILQKRILTDIKKANHSFERGHSFISISYLCEDYIKTILKECIESKLVFRCYITPKIYLDKDLGLISNIPEKDILHDDFMLAIYSICKAIIDNLKEIKLTYCMYCDAYYIEDFIKSHYYTEEHTNILKEKNLTLFHVDEKISNGY